VLPGCAAAAARAGRRTVTAWSAGCASGEEPYSLVLVWHFRLAPEHQELELSIIATDSEPAMIERARRACYAAGSLRELPAGWWSSAFTTEDGLMCLRPALRAGVAFRRSDLREETPAGPFDLILCRYMAFTYFDADGQDAAGGRLAAALRPGGWLVVGKREQPPARAGLAPVDQRLGLYRKERPA
jgi:chemotaxis protein methyltransferase CheR